MTVPQPLHAMPEEPSIQLEIKVTYLEQTLQELNAVVFRQQRMIDALERKVHLLTEHLREAKEELDRDAPAIEKPPHY